MNPTLREPLAKAVEISGNSKTGPCSNTSAAQPSCDPGCAFFDGGGCYGEEDRVGMQTAKLNAAAGGRRAQVDPLLIARQEAREIDRLSGLHDLRLHIVGDCRTNGAARIVARAAERFMRRDRRRAWTYTHAWRKVKRASWGAVSVLASCETAADVTQALSQGWAAALVVAAHAGAKAWKHAAGFTVLPCPHDTHGTQCIRCRLCWDDARLREERIVIGFAAHGAGRKRVQAALIQIAGAQAAA